MTQGIESISDYAITFHYVNVEQLYNLEFYIYHLRPYGIVSGLQDLNNSPPGADLNGPPSSTTNTSSGLASSGEKRRIRR